jgi:hypothetical protein
MSIKNHISTFWSTVFKDAPFINALMDATILRNNQLATSLATLENDLSRYTLDVYRKEQWLFVTYSEADLNSDVMTFNQTDILFDGSRSFGTRGTETRFSLPIDPSLKNIPFILSSPYNPEIVLQVNIDYRIEGSFIYFNSNPFTAGFNSRVVEGAAGPTTGIAMWFYNSDKDYKDLQYIFAEPVKVSAQSDRYFKNVVNSIWNLRIEGGTICNVTSLLNNITDCDTPRTAEAVRDIFTEGGRKWVRTDTHLYSAPEAATVMYSIGDMIEPCQPLFDAVKIYTGLDDISKAEFPAMHLGEGFVGTDFPGGITIENEDYPFPSKKLLIYDEQGAALVEDISVLYYNYLINRVNGYIIDLLVTDTEIPYTLIDSYWDLPFRGQEASVIDFKNYIAGIQAQVSGAGIADIAISNNLGQVPTTINLFKEYQKNIFRNNAFFLVINTSLIPEGVDPSIFLTYVKYTIPAYTTMLTFMGSESTVSYTASNINESLDVFYVADVAGTYETSNISERLDRKDSY